MEYSNFRSAFSCLFLSIISQLGGVCGGGAFYWPDQEFCPADPRKLWKASRNLLRESMNYVVAAEFVLFLNSHLADLEWKHHFLEKVSIIPKDRKLARVEQFYVPD